MNIKGYNSLIEALEHLRKRGFKTSLALSNHRLKCGTTGLFYHPNDMRLVEVHRFKEANMTANFSIIFAVFCNDGTQGLVISNATLPSDMNLIRFMDKVKMIDQSEDHSKAA